MRPIVVGAPGPHPEYLHQVNVSRHDEPFRLDLRGELLTVGDSVLAGVIPMARVVLAGTRPIRSVVVTLGERAKAETDAALRKVQVDLAKRPVQEYTLHVEAAGLTFREAVEALSTPRRRIPVELCQRFVGDGDEIQSPPFGGSVISEQHGPGDDSSSGWFVFDCHSHWYSNVRLPIPWPGNHYTVCHGPCKAAKTCSCNAKKEQWADGWLFCKCR